MDYFVWKKWQVSILWLFVFISGALVDTYPNASEWENRGKIQKKTERKNLEGRQCVDYLPLLSVHFNNNGQDFLPQNYFVGDIMKITHGIVM